MTAGDLQHLQDRTELAERLALVAMEMVLTLGAAAGKQFDLRAYADAIPTEVGDARERDGRRALSATLHRIAVSLG